MMIVDNNINRFKWVYVVLEVLFFILIFFWLTGGMPLIAPWQGFLDAHVKIHKKLLLFSAGSAVILGLLLFEWAKHDKTIGESLLLRMINSWKTRTDQWTVMVFLIFGAWWSISSCLRFEALGSGFDMAIFTQAVWNTSQGHWFYSSIKGGINLLGDHFAPLLGVLALPYRLWPHPELLLLIQAFAAASCVFPLARIVRRSGQSPAWAVLFAVAFVLYLPVRNSVRFEFHPEVAAMPFLFWAYAFLSEKRTVVSSLFLALALMAKENIATVAFVFGLYACLKKERSLKYGLFWMLVSSFYFFTVTRIWIPRLSGAEYFYLDGNFTEWLRLGWGPFANHVFRPATFTYLAKIYGPLAFTSFLAPLQLLLTLPTLAQNILSRNEMTRSIYYQYTATLTPFVFISSVMALAKIRSFRKYWAYLILLTSVLMSGVSEIYPMRRHWIALTPQSKTVAKILRSIPEHYSLRTHEFYATHAANRKELHIYENNHPKEGGSWKARHADLVVIDRQFLKDKTGAAIEELKGSGYVISFEKNGLYVLKKAGILNVLDPRDDDAG